MLNKVILIGNLGKDPETRHLEGGTTVSKFTLATNENYKDRSGEWQKNTEWHDVVVWRHLAEKVERDFKKGMLVYVEGKIKKRKYQDKDGIDRYVVEVMANTAKLLEKRENRGEGGYFPGAEEAPSVKPLNENTAVFDVKEEKQSNPAPGLAESEDDLPF